MAMIGLANSRAALIAASRGVMPASKCRLTLSTTMIASSTTKPMASTKASKVSRLIEKPNTSMAAKVPISDSGIATTGITTERGEPRKRKTTSVTIRIVSPSERSTSLIELCTNTVES